MFEGFQFHNGYYLYALFLLFPFAALCYWLIERHKQHFLQLVGMSAISRAERIKHHHWLRAGLLIMAMAMAIIALARPQWGQLQELVQIKGVDVVIAVDISLSMLADDEPPSRLARARRLCTDLVEQLQGNRMGMIAFAGNSAALIPLTLDNIALKTFIDALDARVVDEPGTSIITAIARATESFKQIGKQSRVLIIVSDGEEQNDDAVDAVSEVAKMAADNGIVIVTVGIGTVEGSNIPLEAIGATGFKYDHEGKQVVTRLEEAVLEAIAEATQGLYLHTQPDGAEVGNISGFIDRLAKGDFREKLVREREERYQYPLIVALLLVLLDMGLLLRRP
jgi:Ca-activated chloride channel family protein